MSRKEGKFLFTSESVTEGHPDKLCDQVSDAVLDAILAKDPAGRVACECLTTTGVVVVAGEITTESWVDIPTIARETIGVPIVNTTMLGAILRATDMVSMASLEAPLEHRFGGRWKGNLEACQKAYETTSIV